MAVVEECGPELREILQADIDFIDRVRVEGFWGN